MSVEELLIALADKLWKGARVEDLERQVVERVAGSADDRLARSRT